MAETQNDLDLDAEWQKQWQRAGKEYTALTEGKYLNEESTVITPEQVITKLRQKGEKDGCGEKWELFALKTGKLLLRLADAGASIAALFFGPAQQATNAIHFLTDVVQTYHKIFEDLQKLFDKLADALGRFEIYRQEQHVLPQRVKARANEILLRLVKVCGLAHRVLEASRGRKLKIFAQSAFAKDDQGINAEIKALDDLAQRELAGNVIEGVIQSSIAATTAKDIREAQKKAEERIESERQLTWLEECISKENQHEAWRRHVAMTALIPGSGTWIKGLPAFQSWTKLTQGNPNSMLLTGVAGSGKTILLAQIIAILDEMYTDVAGASSKPFQVFHYLQPGETMDSALRAMSMQIARSNMEYRKNLYKKLSTRQQAETLPTSVTNLFELLYGNNLNGRPLFLLFDDVHTVHDIYSIPSLIELINHKNKDSAAFKVLLSSRSNDDNLRQLLRQFPSQIDIGLENQDFKNFLQMEVDRLPLLQGTRGIQIKLKKEILDALSSGQSFTGAVLILNEIRATTSPSSIRKILSDTKANSGVQEGIERLIERAAQLPEEDVRDLKALLEWIICLNSPGHNRIVIGGSLHISHLSTLLESRYQEQSLKPLDARLKDEFRGFFTVSEASEVSLAFKGIKEYFENMTAHQARQNRDIDVLTAQSEIKVIKRILKNMCDDEMYSRLDLDAFFEGKLPQANPIHIDTEKILARVTLDMLKLSKPAPLDPLGLQYLSTVENEARHWWPLLLIEIDLARLDPDLKQKLGAAMIPLLCIDADILRWQWAFDGRYGLTEEVVDLLILWLTDRVVQESVDPERKSWIQEVLTSKDPRREILLPMLRIRCRQWLFPEQLDKAVSNASQDPFRWLLAFFDKIGPETGTRYTSSQMHGDGYTKCLAEEIERVADWAKRVLEVKELNQSALTYLADTFKFFGWHQEATNYYKAARETGTETVSAVLSEARSNFTMGKTVEAIDLLQAGILRLEEQKTTSSQILQETRLELARWQEGAGLVEDAINTVGINLSIDPTDTYSILYKMEIYANHERKQDCYLIFENLASKPWNEGKNNNGNTTEEDEWDRMAVLAADYQATMSTNHRNSQDAIIKKRLDGLDEILNQALFLDTVRITDPFGDEGTFYKLMEVARKINYPNLDIRLAKLWAAANLYEGVFKKSPRHATLGAEVFHTIVTVLLFRLVVYKTSLSYRNGMDKEGLGEAIDECEQVLHAWTSVVEVVRVEGADYEEKFNLWLTFLYRARANLEQPKSEEEQHWLQKIDKLWTVHNIYTGKGAIIKAHVLGAYATSRGYRGKAKDYLRSILKAGLDLLSEQDEMNHAKGYAKIGFTLLRADNDADALIALSLANQAKAAASEKQASRTASGESITNKSVWFSCSGDCGHKWHGPEDMFVCKTCYDVQFEEDCVIRVKAGVHLLWLCHPDHDVIYVPPSDSTELANLGQGTVRLDEGEVTIKAWIDGIRKEWDLSD